MGKSNVTLGYLEKCEETWQLESRFFPSKVGGRPAWLDLKNITLDIFCENCSDPCVFLCQIYAPIDSQDSAYHRTLFVFVCKKPECCKTNLSNNFKVFRCQLPQINEYYSAEEPTDDFEWHVESKIENFNQTCEVCGCAGTYQCVKCKLVKYCSKNHQIIDWKAGHKEECGSNTEKPRLSSILFPEYEIIEEEEEEEENLNGGTGSTDEGKTERSQEERFNELKKLMEKGQLQNASEDLLMDLDNGIEYKYIKNFKKKINLHPDQVVRYDCGGAPLLICEAQFIADDIPNCELCKGPRQFEFQILPTLLSYLDVDKLDQSLDWGNLLIYTCANNCSDGPSYKKEFIIKQDVL